VINESFSARFPTVWFDTCVMFVGKELPVNYIDFDEEEGFGSIGHAVDEDDDPIELLDGRMIRFLTVKYIYDEVLHASEFRN
jgi:hypothetical protein